MTDAGAGDDAYHLASLAHDGRLWTAYLEFEDDPQSPQSYRGRLRFEPAAPGDGEEATHTTVLIIEDSYEAALAKARSFEDHQLVGLLRSTLPGDPDDED